MDPKFTRCPHHREGTAAVAPRAVTAARDRAGHTARAAGFYRDFLRMYDLPPAEHRQYVAQAESALARVTGISDRPRARNK